MKRKRRKKKKNQAIEITIRLITEAIHVAITRMTLSLMRANSRCKKASENKTTQIHSTASRKNKKNLRI